jgi:hypothetical protein
MGQVIILTSFSFYPRGKSPRYLLNRRLSGSEGQSGHCGEERNLLGMYCNSLQVQPISCHWTGRPVPRSQSTQSFLRLNYDECKTVTSCRIWLLYFLVFLFHIFEWILLIMSMWGFGRRRSWRVWKAEHDNCLKRPRRCDKIIAEFDRYHNLVLQGCKPGALVVPKLGRRG